MAAITFESFDPTPYQRAPRGNLRSIVSLSTALAEHAPRDVADTVDRSVAGLEEVIAEAEEGLTVRQRETAPVDFSHELEVDGGADALWGALRSGLEAKAAFGHAGIARVLAAQAPRSPVAVALRAAQAQAKQAKALLGTLFGEGGLAFTQRAYPEQVVSMATILRLIDEDGLAEQIDALVGPALLVALRATQPEYQAMVDARLTRDRRSSTDLNRLRQKLTRAIGRHCNAVLALLDEKDPDSLPLVLEALRPVEVFRAQMSARGAAASEEEDGAEEGGGGAEGEDVTPSE